MQGKSQQNIASKGKEMGFERSIEIASARLCPLRASGGISPSMALGTMPTRPALLIEVTDTQGCTGWGEVWANFPPRANLHKAHLIEDVILPILAGVKFCDPREAIAQLRDTQSVYFLHIGQLHVFEHILAGIDMALWDLALRSAGRSFAKHIQIDGSARCYASSLNRNDLEEKLAIHSGLGQQHFKLKLGFDDAGDAAFVARAAQTCPAGSHLMIDTNQKWDLARAQRMLDQLADHNLLFAEEPIPANANARDWEALATSSSISIAGGENIYGIDSFLTMADAGMRYLQPDVAKWGGISGALDLAQVVPDGVRLWPHFMGTALGQIAAASISAAVGDTSVCEVDVNQNPLRTQLYDGDIVIADGRTSLADTPGLVAAPMQDALERFGEPI